jgi:uncharacterized protein (DUF983 family)
VGRLWPLHTSDGILTGDMGHPLLSPAATGLRGRCPRCGRGRLFNRYLTLAACCESCGLDYSFADSADGPAVFAIFAVGAIVVAAAFYVEFAFAPPLWLHMALWVPLILVLSLGLLRPLKGLFVALQFRHGAEEGRLGQRPE